MLLSVAIFFFVVLPALVISVALGVFIWLFAIGMFLGGWTGRRNQIRAERVRRRAELEEEGRQRVIAGHTRIGRTWNFPAFARGNTPGRTMGALIKKAKLGSEGLAGMSLHGPHRRKSMSGRMSAVGA